MPINFRCIKGCGGVSLSQENKVLGIVGSDVSVLRGYTEAILGEYFQEDGKVIYFGDNKAYSTINNEYTQLENDTDFECLTKLFLRGYTGEVLIVIDDITRIGDPNRVSDFIRDNSGCYIVFSCSSDNEEFIKYLPIGIDYIVTKSSRRASQIFFSDTRSSTISADGLAYYKSKTCKACILPSQNKYSLGVSRMVEHITKGGNVSD